MPNHDEPSGRGTEFFIVIGAILLAVAIFFVVAEISRRQYLSLW